MRASLSILSILLVSALLPFIAIAPTVSAQVQYVSAAPGIINLGMATLINVTAPSAGNFTVAVVRPDSSKFGLNYSFTAAGQAVSASFGNVSLGFKTVVSQVGTYNVFLVKAGQVVASASFYATNKLNVFIDFVNGGVCNYIAGATRGIKVFPRFYATYASNGVPLPKSASVVVTFTAPDGSKINASYHAPTKEAPVPYGFYIGKFYPNWNYSAVGPWSLVATLVDGLGNTATYQYVGPPFVVTPAQLSTSTQIIDTGTSQAAGGLYGGQTVQILSTITYPTNAEPVPGFVGVLDSATRGGTVSALVGWGFYNSTSGAFGNTKSPGGLIAKVSMTYTGSNGTWSGTLKVPNLPSIPAGTSYQVIVSSSDKANPPNLGFASVNMPPATVAPGSAPPTTVTQTVTGATSTVTQTASTVTQTATSSGATAAPAGSELTFSVALLTAIGTLIVGLVVGVVVRKTT